jgi:alpha/beta superfamily hydrolase
VADWLAQGRAAGGAAILLPSAAGALEVWADWPAQAPQGVAVVAHPQPLLGGSARHKVPQVLARGLAEAGWLALRPNFRGVGGSAGVHTGGPGEAQDLLALCRALRVAPATSGLPLALVGFSFGAHVQARVATALALAGTPAERVALAGMPVGRVPSGRVYDTPAGFGDALVVHGQADEVVPLSLTLDWAGQHGRPVTVVPGADHFFSGQLPLLRRLVVGALRP